MQRRNYKHELLVIKMQLASSQGILKYHRRYFRLNNIFCHIVKIFQIYVTCFLDSPLSRTFIAELTMKATRVDQSHCQRACSSKRGDAARLTIIKVER